MSHRNEVKSQVNVPFSWEHKPGVSKANHHRHYLHLQESIIFDDVGQSSTLKKLPPPPSSSSKSSAIRVLNHHHDTALKAPSKKHYFKKMIGYNQEEEDPFLVAYNKCTSSYEDLGIRRKRFNVAQTLSCKYSSSCDVASDNLVRMSQISGSMMEERELESLRSC